MRFDYCPRRRSARPTRQRTWTPPSPPGCRRSSSACASSSTRSTWRDADERPALHASVDRLHRESQPWLRDSLSSAQRRAASSCSRSRRRAAGGGAARGRHAARRRRHDAPDRRRPRLGRDDRRRAARIPHKVPVKPSFVTKLNRADALVVQGLGLEHAFLPALLEVARNPKILPTGAGLHRRLDLRPAARGAEQPEPLAGRAAPARQSALQPRSGAGQADGARDRRGSRARRSGGRRELSRRASRASRRCSTARSRSGRQLAAPLRGVKAVSYHQDLVYLAARFGTRAGRHDRDQAGRARDAGSPRGAGRDDEAREGEAGDPRGRLRDAARADRRGAHGRARGHDLDAGGRAAGHADVRRVRSRPTSRRCWRAVQPGRRAEPMASTLLRLEEADFGYEGRPVVHAGVPRGPAGRVRRAARRERQREDHAAARPARLPAAARGPRRAPAGAAHRLRAAARDARPALPALGRRRGADWARGATCPSGASRQRASAARARRARGRAARGLRRAALRRSSRAGSASASCSRARSRPSRSCCCSTSRPPAIDPEAERGDPRPAARAARARADSRSGW